MRKPTIFGIASVYDNAELVPHFLAHYQQLGVERMILSVRSAGIVDEVQTHARAFDAKAIYTPAAVFTDYDKHTIEERLLAAERIDPDDYIVGVDLDEFFQPPCPFSELIVEMDRCNDWAIRAWMTDRIAEDGRLNPIMPTPNIFEQFPIRCDLTASLGAWTQKVPLARRRVQFAGTVRHNTSVGRIDRVPIAGEYALWHFKWTAGLLEKIRHRQGEYHFSDAYRHECRQLLDRLASGRIDTADPRIKARLAGEK